MTPSLDCSSGLGPDERKQNKVEGSKIKSQRSTLREHYTVVRRFYPRQEEYLTRGTAE